MIARCPVSLLPVSFGSLRILVPQEPFQKGDFTRASLPVQVERIERHDFSRRPTLTGARVIVLFLCVYCSFFVLRGEPVQRALLSRPDHVDRALDDCCCADGRMVRRARPRKNLRQMRARARFTPQTPAACQSDLAVY